MFGNADTPDKFAAQTGSLDGINLQFPLEQMSAACRMAMTHGTSHRAYPRYYLHYRHCTHGYCR